MVGRTGRGRTLESCRVFFAKEPLKRRNAGRNVLWSQRLVVRVRAHVFLGTLVGREQIEVVSGWRRDGTAERQTVVHHRGRDPVMAVCRWPDTGDGVKWRTMRTRATTSRDVHDGTAIEARR